MAEKARKKKKISKKQGERREKSEKLKILAAGDFHGNSEIAKRLAEKAKRKKVDLVVLLGDIHGESAVSKNLIAPFKKNKQKVVFIPGNWDTSFETNMLTKVYEAKNVDNHYVTYKDVGIIGVGNPDFQLSVDEDKTFSKLKREFKRAKSKKKILISHMHAADTKAEFSGFKGSSALRRAIDEFKPDLFLAAHIHEAEGIEEKIGSTRVVNVGRKGKIIKI
jgi:Icc-related predicted phosphoesterase